ncbi:unnamed protein product [Leptidea sinapis]|uniref:Carboxylesterase type B domain-containing protein n=1 Tax=Leptidea sinapis TaxID=189913 RepID=A0A5E4R8H1_9NEOP|nr:unnamed protein product [Leptidea sinapis]
MIILTFFQLITLPTLTYKFVKGDTMEEKQPLISSRVVRTKYGDIRGFIVTPDSRFLEPVEVFRGVPYASPPVGSLRFMPPVSGAQWSGVKIAEEFSPVCPQVLPDIRNETAVLKRISKGRLEYLKRILPFLTNQSEDCLFPQSSIQRLSKVTSELRFDGSNSSSALDQRERGSLWWGFYKRLLFHRAILMSGSGLSPWALVAEPNKYAGKVAAHANCSPDTGDMFSNPESGFEWQMADGKPPTAVNIINAVLMRPSSIAQLAHYDLMVGVTKAEAYFAFSGDDILFGIEADRRSRILKAFVRNTYSFHLTEILATIINEYTDWERPVQHPVNIRDETLEALSDAQVVAPIVLTADLHSAKRRNSYVYVFDYQTKNGIYQQRQGCIHGEDLPYIFGAPLVGSLGHFPRNFTKAEIALSETVMLYWGNFAKTGSPNEDNDIVRPGRQDRARGKIFEWTAYEEVHKRYLNIDLKLKLKNHYRAHRLSFWLKLIPDLHRPGGEEVPQTHHRLDVDSALQPTLKTFTPPFKKVTELILPDSATKIPLLTLLNNMTAAINVIGMNTATQTTISSSDVHKTDTQSTTQPEDGFAAYSTALSVTIAIGCSLLILNVLIFAGVYYQRDKTRMNGPEHANGSHLKKRAENGQMPNNICGDLESALSFQTSLKNDPATILSHHHTHSHHQLPPPEFADLPSNNISGMATLPRAPPPPKVASGQLQENQPLLSAHQMQMINTNTLTKKNTQYNAKSNVTMEELRV